MERGGGSDHQGHGRRHLREDGHLRLRPPDEARGANWSQRGQNLRVWPSNHPAHALARLRLTLQRRAQGNSRHGCERSEVGQGGRSAGTSGVATTPSTSRDGWPRECPTKLTAPLSSLSVAKVHSGRFPPGVSTLIRIREPARNT